MGLWTTFPGAHALVLFRIEPISAIHSINRAIPTSIPKHKTFNKKMMTHRMIHFVAILVMSLGFAGQAAAKREAPPKLSPIEFGGSVFTPSADKCGIVVKTDQKTGKVIREIKFYRVTYDPELEKDVQDVWFTDFFRVGDDVWARDEKGRIYKMLLKTLKPSRDRHKTKEEFAELKKSAAS